MTHREMQEQVNQELGETNLLTSLVEREKVTSGLSSGSMVLNYRLSGSPMVGYAWGRIVEIFGPESCGKTTLALHAVEEAQRYESRTGEPVPALFVDAEHALDTRYAADIGIDMENLTISQPDSGEKALDAVEHGIGVGYKLIVVDSVAALTPQAEIDGEMGDSHMGLQARLMSQACRKLRAKCNKAGAIIIFINQLRMKIGIIFGNPEVTTGGNALKFYTTYRLEIRAPRKGAKTGKQTLADETPSESVELGTVANVHVVKNKMYPPHRKASFYIEYGKGIDKFKDALDFLQLVGAFKESKKKKGTMVLSLPSKGKSYAYPSALKLLRTDTDVMEDVINIINKVDEGGV
jgi:recombination protein RecA